MKGKVWTPEQEKQLKKLVEEKASLPVIAETLGKSLEAVRSKAKRLGLVDDDQKKKISVHHHLLLLSLFCPRSYLVLRRF